MRFRSGEKQQLLVLNPKQVALLVPSLSRGHLFFVHAITTAKDDGGDDVVVTTEEALATLL